MNERSFWRLTKGIHIHITLGVILKNPHILTEKKIIWLMRFGVLNLKKLMEHLIYSFKQSHRVIIVDYVKHQMSKILK